MKERRDVFFAIADESRRAILELLAGQEEPLAINTIADNFNISRSGVSKHIKVLSESGLVSTEFHGRENYVSLQAAQLAEVYQWTAMFEVFWAHKLSKLKALVEGQERREKQRDKTGNKTNRSINKNR